MPATLEQRVTAADVWFRRMYDLGFEFPNDYVIFDVETTGLDVNRDYISQFGHMIVENRVPHKPMATLLDWTRYGRVNHGHVRERLLSVEYDFRKTGRCYRFDYDILAQYGADPEAVLEIYYDMFKDHQDAGGFFLTHNGIRYDTQIVASHFHRYLDTDFWFNPNQVVDTGLLEKALQLNMLPEPGETMPSYYWRVSELKAPGVYWSLSDHCVGKYRLDERFRLNMAGAHTSDFDCYVTHLLMETFRQQMDGGIACGT